MARGRVLRQNASGKWGAYMPDTESAGDAPASYLFEFRGKGSEYFRIWIVNLALTIVTLGVFSAWAKVRTKRYFNGNTFIGDHAFDYHASPLRILVGRAIALALFVAYEASVAIDPRYAPLALLLIGLAFPWLVNASLRFNARYTSYRNVRFNFVGRYFEAMVAYVIWPVAGFCTLGLLLPAARRARDYFFTNNHTYGGHPFETKFSAGRVYGLVAIAIGGFILAGSLVLAAVFGTEWLIVHKLLHGHYDKNYSIRAIYVAAGCFYFLFLSFAPALHTMIVNLSVSNTTFDGRHRLKSRMSPITVAWITVTNAILTLLTLGFFYPWAKVRLTRYEVSKLSLQADGDLDTYVSERLEGQSAVGEEIGSVFSFDFGL
jgi:uncharacterized membrane protein YjgN (DUF898 family)